MYFHVEISSDYPKQENHWHAQTAAMESRQPKVARFWAKVPGRLHVLSCVKWDDPNWSVIGILCNLSNTTTLGGS